MIDFHPHPMAGPEDHAMFWSLGDLGDALIVSDWKAIGLILRLHASHASVDSNCVALNFNGHSVNQGSVNATVLIPEDIIKGIADYLYGQLDKVGEGVRYVANTTPPKESDL